MTETHLDRPAPEFDRELAAAMTAAGMETFAVGIEPADVPAGRRQLDELTTPLDALDHRFAITERTVKSRSGGEIPLLIAQPRAMSGNRPILYYVHGGGLISGNNRFGIDPVLDLAAGLGVVVVSVEYRLAPEHPFPAGFDDVYEGLLWTQHNAADISGDDDEIIVMGSSAGGNLAAAAALRARDAADLRLRGQLLAYPMLDDRNDSLSARQMQGRGAWDRISNATAWNAVLGEHRDAPPRYAVPGRETDLSGLAPAYLEVGTAETFRDEVVDYAQRIWSCGGDAELHVWPGAYHAFDTVAPAATISRQAWRLRHEWITRILS